MNKKGILGLLLALSFLSGCTVQSSPSASTLSSTAEHLTYFLESATLVH